MSFTEKQARKLYEIQLNAVREQMPRISMPVVYMALGSKDGKFPSVPRAAIITDVVDKDRVRVCVLNPTGIFWSDVLDRGTEPGNWNFVDALTTFDDFISNMERLAETESQLDSLQ